jgi:hypothetical protein
MGVAIQNLPLHTALEQQDQCKEQFMQYNGYHLQNQCMMFSTSEVS